MKKGLSIASMVIGIITALCGAATIVFGALGLFSSKYRA